MSKLKSLKQQARGELTAAFLEGTSGIDVAGHVRDYHRKVDLVPLRRIIEEAQDRFDTGKAEISDAWLAPRVHATLRLTRQEAADSRLWDFLGIVEFTEYVRWRWGTPTARPRFAGGENTQAVARLWWGAELTRNGADYSPVERAFAAQDIPNTWFRLDAFHHRPGALAALDVIDQLVDGPLPDGTQAKRTKKINMLATALNTMLSTVVLDAVVPWRGEDAGAAREWIAGEVDETLMLSQLPSGPGDEPVRDSEIEPLRELITTVARTAGLLEDPKRDSNGTSADAVTGEGS